MDDLLDLNFSALTQAKPTSSGNFPKPLLNPTSSTSSNGNSASRSQSPAAFDLFAATASRPSGLSSPAFGALPTRGPTPSRLQPASAPKASTGGPDAFSDLLSSFGPASAGGSSVNSRPGSGMGMNAMGSSMSGLTLVERQAKLAREKKEKEEKDRQAFDFDSWGLGTSTGGTAGSRSSPIVPDVTSIVAPTKAANVLQPVPRKAEAPVKGRSMHDDWGFDDLLGSSSKLPPASKTPIQASSRISSTVPADPWDLDALASQSTQPQGRGRAVGRDEPRTNDYSGQKDDEDNLLGDLGRPALKPRAERPPIPPKLSTRAASPPPHIVGQIVEMGFSPAQARSALSKTSTGADVEAAIAMLVGESSGSAPNARSRDEAPSRHLDEVDQEELARERRRRRRQGPTRANLDAEVDERPRSRNTRPDDEAQNYGDVSAQADKILAQASEIGMSVFSKANSLWSQGKERAQKLYEERQAAFAAAERANGNKAKDGDARPRWMIDAEEAQAERQQRPKPSEKNQTRANSNSFKDSDDEDEGPEEAVAKRPPPPRIRQRPQFTEDRGGPASRSAPAPEPSVGDLFGESAPVYKSAGRHKLTASPAPASSATPSRPAPSRSPASLITRPVVPLPSSKVAESTAKKTIGNDHFKLGRFGEATEAYTAALGPLPSGHLLTIPLLNNRAASRVKQGDHAGVIADTTQVITIIGLDFHPAKETPLTGDLAEVKLAEGLFKALSKRATAYEMAEQWSKARDDWERLMGHAVASNQGPNQRKMVSDGLARSRKMASPSQSAKQADVFDAPKPKPRVAPPLRQAPKSNVAFQSKSVAKMREQAAAQESEENQRVDLKPEVDAKVQAWSGGKETNLRGLLSSLDMVLWDGLGVKKPTMAELITEKQVKIGYMRVIGRLHPDKLNSSTANLEQRMIANSVFGILNEAWHAFNGLS